MPTLEFGIDRLSRLVGKKLDIDSLETDLQWIALDIEDINREENKIKVEYSPNRPDFASPEGIARALKGYYGVETGMPRYEMSDGPVKLYVDESVKNVRPYIVCCVIRNIELDDDEVRTVMNIQEALHHTLGRGRVKVAIGVHDFDKVRPPFKYTTVEPDEIKFRPLQMERFEMTPREILEEHPKGIQYAHILKDFDRYPMIFDADGNVVSFPPIINGMLTTVTEATRNFFLDLTGTDYRAVNYALNILATTFADMGARIERAAVIYPGEEPKYYPDFTPAEWTVHVDYINSVIGLNLKRDEMIECLRKCRLDAEPGKGKNIIKVKVPAYRTDFMHEVDFAEEVAIGYGYYNIPPTNFEGGTGAYHPIFVLQNKVKTIMIGAGYLETMNYILTSSEYYKMLKIPFDPDKHIVLLNPVSKDWDIARSLILPVMMKLLQFNRSEEKPIRIFEVGDVVSYDPGAPNKARQDLHVCAITHHAAAEYTEIRSVLDFLTKTLGIFDKISVKPSDAPMFVPGRGGDVYLDGEKIGFIGELHPEALIAFGLRIPTAVFELNLSPLLSEDERKLE